jgi:hypothetical protein
MQVRRDHAATSPTHLFSRVACHVAPGVRKQENPFLLSAESKLHASREEYTVLYVQAFFARAE